MKAFLLSVLTSKGAKATGFTIGSSGVVAIIVGWTSISNKVEVNTTKIKANEVLVETKFKHLQKGQERMIETLIKIEDRVYNLKTGDE